MNLTKSKIDELRKIAEAALPQVVTAPFADNLISLKPYKVIELLDALEKVRNSLKDIAFTKDMTLLGRCCVNDACFKLDEHGCSAQITAHNAFYQNAERAIETLKEVFGET